MYIFARIMNLYDLNFNVFNSYYVSLISLTAGPYVIINSHRQEHTGSSLWMKSGLCSTFQAIKHLFTTVWTKILNYNKITSLDIQINLFWHGFLRLIHYTYFCYIFILVLKYRACLNQSGCRLLFLSSPVLFSTYVSRQTSSTMTRSRRVAKSPLRFVENASSLHQNMVKQTTSTTNINSIDENPLKDTVRRDTPPKKGNWPSRRNMCNESYNDLFNI